MLKKEAEKLPPKEYEVFNKFYKPMYQDIEGVIHDKPGEEGEPKRRMVFGVVEKCLVNHKRRVKKAYQKFGMAAVDAYFFVIGGMVQQKLLDDYNKQKET